MIFWHASRQSGGPVVPTPQQYVWVNQSTTTNEMNSSRDPRTKEQSTAAIVQQQQLDDQSIQDVPLLQKQVESSRPKKSNIWSRLGPEKKEADENWTPDNVADTEQDKDDDDEGVFEGGNIIQELGNKVVGDEMDTIARTADHPYFLRSLMQSKAGELTHTSAIQPSVTVGSGLPDSSTLYNIPYPNIPLLPHSRGHTAGECYDALDARDQAIRKGIYSFLLVKLLTAVVFVYNNYRYM